MSKFSINSIFLVGNVASDPELKFTPNGTKLVNFSMATNRSIKAKDSEQYEEIATFHRIVIYGNIAEYLSTALHKGSKVVVQGRQENRSYQKADGSTGYISEVVADSVIPHAGQRSQAPAPTSTEPVEGEEIFTGDKPVTPSPDGEVIF